MPETDKAQRRDKILIAAIAALTAIITFAVYLPALKNGFVNWDDPALISNNLHIQSINLGFLKWVMTAVVNSNWHPLTMLSHAVDYALWELNPMGHHLTSIIMHALNTFLVALLGFELVTRGRTQLKLLAPGVLATGVAAALLFGLHPLHVESVAWVSERKDVLSALFFLLSLLAYLRYTSQVREDSAKKLNYAASLVLFTLALMSKPMAISLPIVLLILDYYPLKRTGPLKNILVEKLPFFALSVASAVVTLLAQHKAGAIKSLEALAFTERVAVAIRSYAFYIYKMLLPIKLTPFYPLPPKSEFFNLWFFASLALLIAITAFCIYMAVYSAKKRRAFLAAWLYYLVTLLPVIGLVQVGLQAAADRYMYLPSIGPFMLAGLGAAYLIGTGGRRRMMTTACVTIVIIVTLAVMTIKQTAIWKDSITLWTYEIMHYKSSPGTYSLNVTAYQNRATAYSELREFKKAIADYTRALTLEPNYANAYLGRGITYGKGGNHELAMADFNSALEIDPLNIDAYYNRGLAHKNLGRNTEAIEDLRAALRINPEYAKAYYTLSIIYYKIGNMEAAIAARSRAAELNLR
jgi:tetratricopeptide (TPR) repeat protein